MAGLMVDPEPRNCRVSFVDPKGLRHSVDVVAATRNEAAIRALAAFHECGFGDSPDGLFNDVVLIVESMQVESHEVAIAEAKRWLRRHGRPRDVALRSRLKALFPESVRKHLGND